MTDRIPLDHLTSDQYDQLCDQLEALQAVARGYCPECGRGDAGPTAEDWERQRRRADEAEAQLRLVDAMRQQNLDAAAAAIQRADTAEARLHHLQATSEAAGILLTRTTDERDQLRAAVDRAREAAAHYLHEYEDGEDPCAAAVLAALDQPGPAATQATEPAWTPPPPGDKREQLPDAMLDLIRDQMPDYLSTACQTADTLACAACYPGSGVPRPQYDEIREHAERLHQRCRINQKFTGQLCVCGCHA